MNELGVLNGMNLFDVIVIAINVVLAIVGIGGLVTKVIDGNQAYPPKWPHKWPKIALAARQDSGVRRAVREKIELGY